jgi:hypothetical protein
MSIKQRFAKDFSYTISELATILVGMEQRYIDSLGWFFIWPISMLLNMRWQSFSDFMEEHGWEYIGYGEWRK